MSKEIQSGNAADLTKGKTTFTMGSIGVREISADQVEIKNGLAYFKTPPTCPECKGKGFIELLNSKVDCACRSKPDIRPLEVPEADFTDLVNSLDFIKTHTAQMGCPAHLLNLQFTDLEMVHQIDSYKTASLQWFADKGKGFDQRRYCGAFIFDQSLSPTEVRDLLRAMADKLDAHVMSSPGQAQSFPKTPI